MRIILMKHADGRIYFESHPNVPPFKNEHVAREWLSLNGAVQVAWEDPIRQPINGAYDLPDEKPEQSEDRSTMAEDTELQAQMTSELQEVGERLHALMLAFEQTKFTAQECAASMYQIAPILQDVYQQTIGNDAIWQARIDGPIYRQTFILGRFRWYRRYRVWRLRQMLTP